jgi:hypothetical protein
METNSKDPEIQLIQPLLTKFLKEKQGVESSAKINGKIPRDLCSQCPQFRTNKITLKPLNVSDKKGLPQLLKWVGKNNVASIQANLLTGMSFDVGTRKPIPYKQVKFLEKGIYYYDFSTPEALELDDFFVKSQTRFEGLSSCPHFDPQKPTVMHLLKEQFSNERLTYSNFLFLCCEQCSKEEEEEIIGCGGLVKRGFIFDVRCDLTTLLFERILNDNDIVYEKEQNRDFYPNSSILFLRDKQILVNLAGERLDETMVSMLNPKLIVNAGTKSTCRVAQI